MSASSLKNLVRIKATGGKKSAHDQQHRSKLFVKTKVPRKHFKIQKTYRFRNYRLRCIRLRRESQQKQRRHNKQILLNHGIPFLDHVPQSNILNLIKINNNKSSQGK